MAIQPSLRSDIAPFQVMEVFEAAERRAATGAEVVRLEVGQPLTAAPKGVIERAHQILDTDRLGYASTHGVPELRHAIAAHYSDWYGLDLDPHRVVVTVGASGGFTLAFLAAFDHGDRVALTIPGYPCYRNALKALGAEVVPLMTTLEDNFQPTIELLEAAHAEGDLDGLVITSPSNPTGTMLGDETLAAILDWCAERGVKVVSDEIYHGLTYRAAASTALGYSDDVLVVNSFSKYFSMTGWRLGWLVVPENFVSPIVRFAANLLLGPQTLSQMAAVAAFECHDELQGHLVRYGHNRQILLEGLRSAGLDRLAPAEGAFYIYADISDIADSSTKLCADWLAELGIAATPGTDFDPFNGERYVRFSFCAGTDTVQRGVELINTWRF
jgi:aspartate/methionine/tyrosine aminotransferase